MLHIAILIIGLCSAASVAYAGLIRGRLSVTRRKATSGTAARVIGALCLAVCIALCFALASALRTGTHTA